MSLHFHFDEVTVTHPNGVPTSAKTAPCCSECGHSAIVMVAQLGADGKVTTTGYCLRHAISAGLLAPNAWDLLGESPRLRHQGLTCECGMTERLLRATGRAGCSQCYTTFKGLLDPTIREIRIRAGYAGKTPSREADANALARHIAGLKASIAMAILDENYEQAALYRDELATLKGSAQ